MRDYIYQTGLYVHAGAQTQSPLLTHQELRELSFLPPQVIFSEADCDDCTILYKLGHLKKDRLFTWTTHLHILGVQAVDEDFHKRVQHFQHMLTTRLDLGSLQTQMQQLEGLKKNLTLFPHNTR